MNSNSGHNNLSNQQNKEEINIYTSKEDLFNNQNQSNVSNNSLSNMEQNFNNENKCDKNKPPKDLLEKLNSKSINEYINSLLFQIKNLNLENEELKLNFVQVSELREKETQDYRYNLNVLKSNIEILEQDKQRHIKQNIIEKENLENQVQILMKENIMLNKRIKEIIEQNEILKKQIFDLNVANFGKNKKLKNANEYKNRMNKNNRINNTEFKKVNNKNQKDKNNIFYNSNIRTKNNISINLKSENKNKINFPMKTSKTSKFRENNNTINFDKNFSIEIKKLDKNMINSNSITNNNLISKESTKFNIIENDYGEKNKYNENESVKIIPQNFNSHQLNINEGKKEKNNINNTNEEILHFAKKYLNNPDINNNYNKDLLLKNDSIEINKNDFDKLNQIKIDEQKN